MAFRSLSRLSSALSAKASTLRSSLLDLTSHKLYSVITLCLPLLLVITRNNILDSLLISIGLFGRYFKNILICVKFSRYMSDCFTSHQNTQIFLNPLIAGKNWRLYRRDFHLITFDLAATCFPKTVLLDLKNHLCGPNPAVHAPRFGLFRFRSPLLPESMFLSLPPAT